jgi:hypothetical protein
MPIYMCSDCHTRDHTPQIPSHHHHLNQPRPQLIFDVPFPRDKHFVHRRNIFDKLDTCTKHHEVVILHGLGGTGYVVRDQ